MIVTIRNINWLDIHVYEFYGVHSFEIFKQLTLNSIYFFNFIQLTLLHRKKYHRFGQQQVVAEKREYFGSNFQDIGQDSQKVLLIDTLCIYTKFIIFKTNTFSNIIVPIIVYELYYAKGSFILRILYYNAFVNLCVEYGDQQFIISVM